MLQPKRLATLAAWLVLLALIANSNRIWSSLVQADYHPVNKNLEGARILEAREDPVAAARAAGATLFVAGTSRSMANYDAVLLAELLGRDRKGEPYVGYNLGNVANHPSVFMRSHELGDIPGLWIIEFSPHMLLDYGAVSADPPGDDTWEGRFRRYRARQLRLEARASGLAAAWTGFADRARLTPGTVARAGLSTIGRGSDSRTVFYQSLHSSGPGQVLHRNGHVHYFRYLPGVESSTLLRRVQPGALPGYHATLSRPFVQAEWDAYRSWVRTAAATGSAVVVRPPVSPELYALEIERTEGVIRRVTDWLETEGIPYIDLNDAEYGSTDGSHVDWYDTERLTRTLAAKVGHALREDKGTVR